MAFLPNVLTVIGLFFLTHAIYSAYEHVTSPIFNSASSRRPSISLSATPPREFYLPPSIQLEALFSTALLTFAIVLSAAHTPSAGLRPIQWRAWAGKIERTGWDPNEGVVVPGGHGNPFAVLEGRKGFWDVRGRRREFADWVREGRVGSGVVKER